MESMFMLLIMVHAHASCFELRFFIKAKWENGNFLMVCWIHRLHTHQTVHRGYILPLRTSFPNWLHSHNCFYYSSSISQIWRFFIPLSFCSILMPPPFLFTASITIERIRGTELCYANHMWEMRRAAGIMNVIMKMYFILYIFPLFFRSSGKTDVSAEEKCHLGKLF